jgi:hypothetical protein
MLQALGGRWSSWRPFVGTWLAAGGATAAVAALFAHPLGLATQPAFGWKRQTLTVAGLIALGAGAWLLAPEVRRARGWRPRAFAAQAARQVKSLAREHRAFTLVLLLAVAARALVALSYWPGLLWGDSWTYADMAFRGSPVLAAPYPQSGYPLAMHVISLPGRNVAAIVTVQHLVGLLTGVLVYALLVRLSAPRWAAVTAAALVLLSASNVVLEQRVMAETFFSLALVGAAFLTVASRRGPAALALAALLIAWAVTLRTAGSFVVPVWLAYVLAARVDRRVLANTAVFLALPLAGYAYWYHQGTGTFGFTQSDGWFLYGRVAAIADCKRDPVPEETRGLCNTATLPANQRTPADYIWDPNSPARRTYNMFDPDIAHRKHVNATLRQFALTVIVHHPVDYARVVSDDFARFFTDAPTLRPESGLAAGVARDTPLERAYYAETQARTFPDYKHPDHTPAATGLYLDWVWTPPWLLGALGAFALLAVAALRRQMPHRREILLLVGTALAVLLGSAATAEWQSRHLVSTSALLIAGGMLAAADVRQWRVRSRH